MVSRKVQVFTVFGTGLGPTTPLQIRATRRPDRCLGCCANAGAATSAAETTSRGASREMVVRRAAWGSEIVPKVHR
jgi:hypothetical protein